MSKTQPQCSPDKVWQPSTFPDVESLDLETECISVLDSGRDSNKVGVYCRGSEHDMSPTWILFLTRGSMKVSRREIMHKDPYADHFGNILLVMATSEPMKALSPSPRFSRLLTGVDFVNVGLLSRQQYIGSVRNIGSDLHTWHYDKPKSMTSSG